MLGYNGFIQETEDAALLVLGRNGFIQPGEERGAPPAAAVVPASFVVASDREDYPLTQTGLSDALTAVGAAGGGDIYIGAGTLAITAVLTIPANTRIFGAGIGVTNITLASGITLFNLGAFSFTLMDLSISGNNSAAQKILNVTATSELLICMERVTVGTSATTGAEVVIDGNSFARNLKLSNCRFYVNGPGVGWLYDAAGTGTMEMSNIVATQEAAMDTGPTVLATNCIITGGATTVFLAGSRFTGCQLNAETLTFGAQCELAGCTVSADTTLTFGNGCDLGGCAISSNVTFGTTCNVAGGRVFGNTITGASCNFSGETLDGTLTAGASSTFTACTVTSTAAPAASCLFSSCTIGGAVTVSGASTKFSNCTLVSFSSTSLNSHVIKGCSFSGASNNITLASSSSCQVHGNVGAQVIESGSSDSNTFSSIAAGSTLIGASSQVTDAQKFAWTSPDVLTITDNAFFARIAPQVTQGVRLLSVDVETAPTGAALLVAFRIGTRSTGALAAAFATVTVAIGAFTGSTTVAGITLAPTQFLVCEITQVGSTIAGANATMVARA